MRFPCSSLRTSIKMCAGAQRGKAGFDGAHQQLFSLAHARALTFIEEAKRDQRENPFRLMTGRFLPE